MLLYKFLQDFLPDSAICASSWIQEKKNVGESNATVMSRVKINRKRSTWKSKNFLSQQHIVMIYVGYVVQGMLIFL
jgi:hypothetical protein